METTERQISVCLGTETCAFQVTVALNLSVAMEPVLVSNDNISAVGQPTGRPAQLNKQRQHRKLRSWHHLKRFLCFFRCLSLPLAKETSKEP